MVKIISNNLCEFLARSKRSIMLLRFFDDASQKSEWNLVRHSKSDFVSILITLKTIPNNLCEFLARSKRSIMLLRFFDDASAWQHDDDDTGTSFNISHFHHKGSLLTSGPGGMVSKLVGTAESTLVEQEHVSVSSTPKDFQAVYEGEIWCSCTVTFGQKGLKLNSILVCCSGLCGTWKGKFQVAPPPAEL